MCVNFRLGTPSWPLVLVHNTIIVLYIIGMEVMELQIDSQSHHTLP
jgi:hypothetical protein